MYAYRISGTFSGDGDEPSVQDYRDAQTAYHAHLTSRDLTRAGDLLLYFGYDFFHDAGIEAIALANDGRDIHIDLQAWIDQDDTDDDDDLPGSVDFQVRFHDVVWTELARRAGELGFREFLYSEIDGLATRIDAAVEEHEGEFHSLAIECVEGWIGLVFRSVSVVPVDPILWTRMLREPRVKPCLYGIGASS